MTSTALSKSFLPRFAAGWACSVAAGLLVFRWATLSLGDPAFHCVAVGAVTAGILSAVRLSRHGLALAFVVAFGVARFGLAGSRGWPLAVSGFVFAAGIYLISLVFDLLGRRGIVFGKFLILGPLLGGLYLALTPLAEFHALTTNGVLRTLISRVLLGLIVGDGVGFGVESVELLLHGRRHAGSGSG